MRFAEQYHAKEEEESGNGLKDDIRANVFDVTGDKLAMDLSDLKKQNKKGSKLPAKCGYHRPAFSNEFQHSNPPWALRIIGKCCKVKCVISWVPKYLFHQKKFHCCDIVCSIDFLLQAVERR